MMYDMPFLKIRNIICYLESLIMTYILVTLLISLGNLLNPHQEKAHPASSQIIFFQRRKKKSQSQEGKSK